jgi:hypothetical protein
MVHIFSLFPSLFFLCMYVCMYVCMCNTYLLVNKRPNMRNLLSAYGALKTLEVIKPDSDDSQTTLFVEFRNVTQALHVSHLIIMFWLTNDSFWL